MAHSAHIAGMGEEEGPAGQAPPEYTRPATEHAMGAAVTSHGAAPIAALAAIAEFVMTNQMVIHATDHLDIDERWHQCPHSGCRRAKEVLAKAGFKPF